MHIDGETAEQANQVIIIPNIDYKLANNLFIYIYY